MLYNFLMGKRFRVVPSVLRIVGLLETLFHFSGTNLWKPVGARAVFGGQIIGQAMAAAAKTKPSDVSVHSIHCYFIRPGIWELLL